MSSCVMLDPLFFTENTECSRIKFTTSISPQGFQFLSMDIFSSLFGFLQKRQCLILGFQQFDSHVSTKIIYNQQEERFSSYCLWS
jgi:hypothetical protein